MKYLKILLLISSVVLLTACGGSGSSSPADTTAPIIILKGDNSETVLQYTLYNDPGAVARDNVDGIVPTTVTGSVDTLIVETYTLTYKATDKSGNIATKIRTVTVVVPPDTIPPVITLNGDNLIILVQGDTYTEEGATASDDKDGNVPVVITGTVDTATAGTYTLTYTATDSANNTSSTTRTVNVEPLITHNVSTVTEFRQALLDAASNQAHDKIVLAQGVYKTTDDSLGTFKFLDTESYQLRLQGSDPQNTILSGDNIDKIFDCKSTQPEVLSIDSLTFQDGNISTAYQDASGVYANMNVVISNSKFLNNHNKALCGLDINITNSEFTNNYSNHHGGAISANNINIRNSNFTNNISSIYGGGFSAYTVIIENSKFERNKASHGGGFSADTVIINNTLFKDNIALDDFEGVGGGFSADSATVKNSEFIDNSASLGGGFACNGDTLILNSKFINNTSSDMASMTGGLGAAFWSYGKSDIFNSIFYGNQSIGTDTNAGIVSFTRGNHHFVTNSIFEANNGVNISGADNDLTVTLTNNYIDTNGITVSLVEVNNIFSGIDLGFIDEANLDFHLTPNSDLIDMGANSAGNMDAPTTDFDGNPRPVGASIDIGTYEYQP